MLVDTHAHIHFDEYNNDLDEVFNNARINKISSIITVGTNGLDSKKAVDFVSVNNPDGINLYATVGVHPHDAKNGIGALNKIKKLLNNKSDKIVAVGECGLDYFRNLSPKKIQEELMRAQIELAVEHHLPIVFHVRDAWDDFFDILGDYTNISGVIHSFTGGPAEVEKGLYHNLYFGLNGIMTFTKLDSQLEAARIIPDDKLLFETDCPFLTPMPHRGKRNEPANVAHIARFLAKHRDVNYDVICETTTKNAQKLFGIKNDR